MFADVDNAMHRAGGDLRTGLSVIPADDEERGNPDRQRHDLWPNAAVFTPDAERRGGRAAAALRHRRHNGVRIDFSIGFGGFKQSGIGREGGREGLRRTWRPRRYCWTRRHIEMRASRLRQPPSRA